MYKIVGGSQLGIIDANKPKGIANAMENFWQNRKSAVWYTRKVGKNPAGSRRGVKLRRFKEIS